MNQRNGWLVIFFSVELLSIGKGQAYDFSLFNICPKFYILQLLRNSATFDLKLKIFKNYLQLCAKSWRIFNFWPKGDDLNFSPKVEDKIKIFNLVQKVKNSSAFGPKLKIICFKYSTLGPKLQTSSITPKYYRETNLWRVANITVSSTFSIKLTQLTFKRLNWQCIYK